VRKVIIAGAVVAAGAAGYFFTQQGSMSASSPLAYVPSDTVLFSGQLKPFPLKDYLQSTASMQAKVPEDFKEAMQNEPKAEGRFLMSLANSYLEAAGDPAKFQKTFALPDQLRAVFYAVGFIPVLRYEVTDEQGFWAVLDKAEQDSGLKHEVRKSGELEYRAYLLDNNSKNEKFELLVAYQNGWATWTANTHITDAKTLDIALAQVEPAQSLEKSGKLDTIATKHGFDKGYLSYIDHQELVTAFTTDSGNTLASMITTLLNAEGEADALADVRNPECKAEMAAIAANWPRTVFGIRSADDLKITPERSLMRVSTVVESNNKAVLDALTSMQGFIPSYLEEKQALGFGFGLEADKLGAGISALWSNMLEPQYKCAPLAEIQAAAQSENPAALAMFTGMAQGVKGAAFSIKDFTLNTQGFRPKVDSIDGIVSLSAENPKVLFDLAKSFVPPLAAVQLPTDGTAVDLSTVLPVPNDINVKPMLALKGQHIVIYSGTQGEALANKLGGETPTSNGLMSMAIDYKQMLTPVLPMIEQQADPEVAEQLAVLKNMDLGMKVSLNLNGQGIQMNSEVDVKAAAK